MKLLALWTLELGVTYICVTGPWSLNMVLEETSVTPFKVRAVLFVLTNEIGHNL